MQKIYKNHTDPRTEAVLLEFGTFQPSYKLTNGKTLAEDMVARPKQGAQDAAALVTSWQAIAAGVKSLNGGEEYYNTTLTQLQAFALEATQQSAKIARAVGKITKVFDGGSPMKNDDTDGREATISGIQDRRGAS